MKALNNRLDKIEAVTNPEALPTIERVIFDSSEQVKHPERFEKILISENVSESGCRSKVYELKRK
ncbi:MAG: hypothetical protein FH748_08735 [Balneolaceae bacterium]|nr:hypothetical protein [Balneolaceae bacterium]